MTRLKKDPVGHEQCCDYETLRSLTDGNGRVVITCPVEVLEAGRLYFLDFLQATGNFLKFPVRYIRTLSLLSHLIASICTIIVVILINWTTFS